MDTEKKVTPIYGSDRKDIDKILPNYENNINNFIELMEKDGLQPPRNLIPGKIHRFPGKDKSKRNKAGWCKLFDDMEAGVYGDWSNEEEETRTWRSPHKLQRKISQHELDSAKAASQNELELEHENARKTALRIIKDSQPALSHTYLAKKGIKAHGLSKYKNELVIPLSDNSGRVNTIQFINEVGRKRFLKGGKVEGYFTIGLGSDDNTICITEGFATGASVHEATNYKTIVCCGKNNLFTTAKTIRDLHPNSKIILCADNDWSNPENPGKKAATKAARSINGFIALPEFDNQPNESKFSDFNDLSLTFGKDRVIECIEKATKVEHAILDEASRDLLQYIAGDENADFDQVASRINLNTKIIESIYKNCIWNPLQKKFYLIAPAGDLKIFSKDEFSGLIDSVFDNLCDYRKLNDQYSLEPKHLFANLRNLAIAHRQATNFSMQVDLFAESGSVLYLKKDASAKFIYSHEPFTEDIFDDDIIKDYKAHFPELDEVLSFIVASRFAPDRKQCYLWINAESDWGKNFFLDALKRHSLVVETSMSEIEKLFSGGPVGKTIAEFKKAWILAVDEFKGVKSELKQLKDEMPVSPKNQATTWVPIYLKLFLSAEQVSSLASSEIGIEDQFANRFTLIRGQGQLNTRQYFINGKSKYFDSVRNYVASYLNKETKTYIGVGKQEAAWKAEKEISVFFSKFKIDNSYTRLSKELPELASDFCCWAINIYLNPNIDNSHTEKAIAKSVRVKNGSYYLKGIHKLFESWLDNNFSRSETHKIGYKRNQIIQLIGRSASTRIDGIPEKLTLVPDHLLMGKIKPPDF